MRYNIAKACARGLHWGLTHVARRPGQNLPGKMALKIDPHAIADARGVLSVGSIMVTGTNGKTTVNNLIADVLERAGRTVCCNRTGANLAYGVASALLNCKGAEWGVIESDELWLGKSLPQLQPTYLVLLDLFRDQLDRVGEIDHIQDVIVEALGKSPNTQLIYNADDPLCAMVAERAAALPGRENTRSVAFGVGAPLNLEQNIVSDTTMCQRCNAMLEYEWRQYGQLGAYTCPACGFARPALDIAAENVEFDNGVSFEVAVNPAGALAGTESFGLHTKLDGSYMVYNMTAVAAVSVCAGASAQEIQGAIDAFNPKNGRLQHFRVGAHNALLNLAKNPTGFNQNLRIVVRKATAEGASEECAIAFFINDNDVDGHDISWIWDIDFEELARVPHAQVFAGGTRKNDLQVRLKYAGVRAQLVDTMDDVFSLAAHAGLAGEADVYAIANYTALAPVHSQLDYLQEHAPALSPRDAREKDARNVQADMAERTPHAPSSTEAQPVVIAHMFPDLLNLYGDGGNVRILEQRLRWRGIPVEVRNINFGESVNLDEVDLVFLGGGPDREQTLAAEALMEMRDEIAHYVEDGGCVLAICGGYQILGETWLSSAGEVPGLDVLPIATRRPGTSTDRLIDNIALSSPVALHPVIGYENHASHTYLSEGAQPFGRVISVTGHGNNEHSHADGVLYRNVLGTYLHGTLLAKNPEVADWLLERALARCAMRNGAPTPELAPLSDAEELEANAVMAKRLIRK